MKANVRAGIRGPNPRLPRRQQPSLRVVKQFDSALFGELKRVVPLEVLVHPRRTVGHEISVQEDQIIHERP